MKQIRPRAAMPPPLAVWSYAVRLVLGAVIGVFASVSAVAQEARTWTDDTGKHQVEAVLKEIKRDAVVLTLPDGSATTVPLKRLSEADREFVAGERRRQLAENAERAARRREQRAAETSMDLQSQWQAVIQEFQQRAGQAQQAAGGNAQRYRQALQELANEFAPRILAMADDSPGSELAKTAYTWVAANTREGVHFNTAMQKFIEQFPDIPEMTTLAMLIPPGTPENDRLLNQMIEKTSLDSVKAGVMFHIAQALADREGQAAEDRAVELLTTIMSRYPKIENARGQALGPLAERLMFVVQNLRVGKVAPDIEGNDLDGVAFKLSDYRGKVVLLDFWGDW